MRIPPRISRWLAALVLSLPAFPAQASPLTLAESPGKSAFPLVDAHTPAPIYVSPTDFKVAQIAAQCLASDIQSVTDQKPQLTSTLTNPPKTILLIGTLGKCPPIDNLVQSGKLDTTKIAGKWESFLVTTIANPLPGITSALVIAGSDRRGTAYGVFTLSAAIGVSPWVWWSDVTPAHRDNLFINPLSYSQPPPSVKYRGIFINDEDWSLQPWAAKTYDPETKDIGPKTYARVCELLLRLKANYLWPAMHPCTKAFNTYPQDKIVADNYAIVMGSSHAEPMLRDNVGEWDLKTRGPWDYDKNREGILTYWNQRLQENKQYENIYTIGMRGIHDSAMPGSGTTQDKVARLQRVIQDQRQLLTRDINPDATQVPQIFVPYKEVLTLYQNGLKLPPDVTLVWPDDNHGYIRRLSTPEEQKRPGGAGVYYHVSYWGAPEDYLWLCTTPPALIWEEMSKAYHQGARTVWVLNVGGLKKSAIDMEFFLSMAWDINAWDQTAQPTYLAQWAGETFGPAHATAIATILNQYYLLNYPAKPEHLLTAHFNSIEKQQRLQAFAKLVDQTNALYNQMLPYQKDAFFELVVYPVRCSALMNEKWLGPDPAKAYAQIQSETNYYNEQLAGGKWNHIMSANPRNRPVFQNPVATASPLPANDTATSSNTRISIDAQSANKKVNGAGATWKVISGLGRSAASITLLPADPNSTAPAELDYNLNIANSGLANVQVYCIPTHALNSSSRLRYSAAIDSEPPQTVDIDTAEFSPAWSVNVLRAAAISATTHQVGAGHHTLKIRPLDPGVVFDKVLVDPPQ